MTDVQSGQRYKIVNAKGGTVLDLNSETVIGWSFHGGDNQIWEASEEDGRWHFRNVASGKYLAISGTERDGLQIIGSDEPTGWHLWPDQNDESTLRICLPDTVFNIDLSGNGDSADGTPVELWGRWEGVNQTWRFESV